MVIFTILILSVTFHSKFFACGNDVSIVNDYIEYLNNRSAEALSYKFPTDARMYEAEDKVPQEYGYYDFVIIGAGSTGCVIANRLSEITKWKILLLEAGTYPDEDITDIPAYGYLNTFTKFNWGFESVPQKNSLQGNEDKKCWVQRGKGVGGSSLINGFMYTRGNKRDYNIWANLVNDSRWNYETLLYYFKKSDHFTRTNPYSPIDKEYHGYDGLLYTTQSVPPLEISTTILKGVRQLGYNITDFNGKQQLGGSITQYTMKNGKRYDAGKAFVLPAKNRKNLEVLDRSYVIKIEINNSTKKAESVIFTRDNKTYFVRARKEIILSAGAISSPQILLLSGVGPRSHLESLGVPVIQNLPVGKNLHSNTYTYLILSSNITNPTETLEKSVRDLLNGRGSLTKTALFDFVSWFKTPVEQIENYPDIEIFFTNFSDSALSRKYYRFSNETFSLLNPNVSNPFALQITLLHEKSEGTVKLKSANPFDYPLIDPNYLSDKNNSDIETLYQAVLISLQLLNTDAFRSLNISLVHIDLPECRHDNTQPLSRRDYWYCYFRRITSSSLHFVGTCSTGKSPKTSVVDSELKVFGIEGLRVADASVIPFSPSGHTNAACTMVGERVSDFIKHYYSKVFV